MCKSNRVIQLIFLTIVILLSSHFVIGQNTKDLEGLTEAILIDGQPTLRIILGKNNSLTEIKFLKRDGEDALEYNVYLNQKQGKLYITNSRIVFVPLGNKKNYFNFEKTKIKEVSLNKPEGTNRFVKMYIDNGETSITVDFGEFIGVDKNSITSANKFLLLAIKDFESAFAEFNRLTASIRQNEEVEEIEEEETETDINDTYDRFKDITIVSTSKMLVRGNKRSIRAFADYNFAGKTQKKPENISLYFNASAARPIFREDNLELNFLVDGKRVALGEMQLADEEKTKTRTKQTAVITMPYQTFEQIANGKNVEFQIGNLEYKLTDVHLEAFRKLLSYKIEE